ALAESNLPFPVDLHVWDEVPERFREIIRKEYVAVQEDKQLEIKTSMPGEWRKRPIGELVEIFDGPHATPAKTQAGPIFLGISNLAQGRVNLSEAEHLSEDDYVRWTRRVEPRAGDVVFSYETRLGEAARVPQGLRCCLGRRMGLLRARSGEIDERFLLYAYLGPQFQETLRARTVPGSTVDRIPLIDMPQFPMVVPTDLVEQRAIAHILGTLDDKIELNRRMNETLEAMARALFKSWFIDFDPVRRNTARARNQPSPRPTSHPSPNGRGEGDEGVVEGKAYDHLFPDSFVDSELGEIPKGWAVGTLADFASLNAETWSKNTRPDTIKYVDLSNTKWGRIDAVTTYLQEDAPSRAQRVLRPGDTIVGTVRPGNGSYALVSEAGLTGSTGFAVLRPLSKKHTEFTYLAATAPENIEALQHLADGGAYPAVRPEVVSATLTIRPRGEVLALFSRISEPLLASMAQNERESRSLAALRDTLLPKLISGEQRVKEAKSFLEQRS
ncbi:MAG: restriction endonuclease subunit S, partial [Nitrospira sp.]|nr:restriction endonuclease subunit S [Nitrospira sp.]